MSATTTKNPATPNQQAAEQPQPEIWVTRGVEYPILAKVDVQARHIDTDNGRTWDDLSEKERESNRRQGFYFGNWNAWEAPVRKLNEDERKIWGKAIFQATLFLPSFSPSISIMSPVRDRTAGTVYTDENARVGLGDNFFYKWNDQQRATAVIHESMHVLYNHFARFKRMTTDPNQLTNIAGDFEINGALKLVRRCDISMGVHPEDKIDVAPDHPWAPLNGKPMWGSSMRVGMTAEEYYALLEKELPDDGDGQGQPGSGQCPVHGQGQSGGGQSQPGENGGEGGEGEGGQGDSSGEGQGQSDGDNHGGNVDCGCQGWTCGTPSDEKSQEMDEAGVKGASDTEKENARANTRSKVIDEQKRSRSAGTGAGDAFLSMVIDQLNDPKVPWQSIFRQVFTRSMNNIIAGRTDYSYRRTNRRMTGSKYIFPGTISYLPEVAFGIDTSGSMATPDYMALLNEAEMVIKTVSKNGKGLSVFSVDTEIANVQKVKSIKDIDLRGGGGTDMSVAFRYLNDLPPKERPDMFVLATDGFVPWQVVIDQLERREARYKSIILITNEDAYNGVPDRVKKLAVVIDVSPDESK